MADEPANKPEATNETAPTPTETPASSPAPTAPANAGAKTAKSSNKNLFIIIAVIALIAGGAFYKNQQDKKNAEKTAESFIESLTGSDVDIDSKDNSFSINDEDGNTTVETGQELPDDFPKDAIPYLDEKKVTLVFSNTTEGKKSWSVTTTVDKSVDEAVAHFESTLVEPNYTEVSSYGYNDTSTFSARTAVYSIYVTVSKSENDPDTVVSYVISQE